MRPLFRCSTLLTCCLFFLMVAVSSLSAQTPVADNGAIRVAGNRIVNQSGEPVQLRGMSLFWSQWMPQFYNPGAVSWLKEDWNCSIVRAAMAVDQGGYLTNPAQEQAKVEAVVDAAIAEGLYVIIDWHTHYAENWPAEAESFFGAMAQRYGHHPNVIYEIYNEPLDVSWSAVIKPYAEGVIAAIRQHDPDNLIVVGTRNWSQQVAEAAADPIVDPNVAYTLHFYAGTHGQWLRDQATTALNQGAALFVTEYGTTEASGDGSVYPAATQTWWDFLDANDISHCNWSIADKNEASAALVPGANATGNWPLSDITTSGQLVRDMLRGHTPPPPVDGNIKVRARGDLGGERIAVVADGNTIATFDLTTSYQIYSANGSGFSTIRLDYINDTNERNAQVDYLEVDGTIHQAEDQPINTGVWQGQCGGSFAEYIHCPGYIEFSDLGGGDDPTFFTLTTAVSGSGTVTVSPAGGVYEEGTEVTLTATPAADQQFDGWSGAAGGTQNPLVVTVTADISITANFSAIPDGGDPCASPTPVSMPFYHDGAGTYCWVTSGRVKYVNSWNTTYLRINGQDYTNVWSNQLPPTIDGSYYIEFSGEVDWAHFEIVRKGRAKNASAKPELPDNPKVETITAYPNPFRDQLSLLLPAGTGYEAVRITDELGRVVWQQELSATSPVGRLEIGQTLPAGVYAVQVFRNGEPTVLLVRKE